MVGLVVAVDGDKRWLCDVVVRDGRSAPKAERSFDTRRRDCQCQCSRKDKNDKKNIRCQVIVSGTPLFLVPRSRSQMFPTFVSLPKDQDADVRFSNSVLVITSLDAEAISNVQYRWQCYRDGCMSLKSQNTCAAAPQHAADNGDRGARGSSGSCSANGPGGCCIFANYCCSVRVCARGQICGLTSIQHLEKEYLVPRLRSGRNTPFRWIFPSWKLSVPAFVSTCCAHRSYCRL